MEGNSHAVATTAGVQADQLGELRERVPAARVDEILERTTAYFESTLWDSEIGGRVRARLARLGIEAPTLRSFRVGYAPGDTQELLGHLAKWQYSGADLIAAGIASRSDRSRLHVLFHARIMFPITDAGGRVLGFAGLATHLGPSWPLWMTTPKTGSFDAGSAIFGIGQAAPAILQAGRALVLRDCVQVLALHQHGRPDVVGVIQSPITRTHTAQLASALGIGPGDLHYVRADGRLGVVAAPAGATIDDDAFATRTTPAGFTLIDESKRRAKGDASAELSVPANLEEEPTPTRRFVYLAGAAVGVGMPIGLLVVAGPHGDAAGGSTPALNVVIVGVALAYVALALVVSRISARVRARSRTRRMREPWARGSDEWQPAGWTYHRLEEILVGAALASAVTCLVLLMTLGGFLG
jgi:hypothetical protein